MYACQKTITSSKWRRLTKILKCEKYIKDVHYLVSVVKYILYCDDLLQVFVDYSDFACPVWCCPVFTNRHATRLSAWVYVHIPEAKTAVHVLLI